MALFSSDLKDIVRRLTNQIASPEERELLKRLEASENIRARDVAWMLVPTASSATSASRSSPGSAIRRPWKRSHSKQGEPEAAMRSAIQNLQR